MEEALGLIVAANEAIQDPALVGTALKTVSMRIRGVGEDIDDATGYVVKLEDAFQSVGITLKENDDTFKSTYDIMKDLSEIWEDLTDIQRAYILELVAGKEFAPLCSNAQVNKLAISGEPWGQATARKDFLCA